MIVPYQVDERTRSDGEEKEKKAWLVKVEIEETDLKPWYLLTDLRVKDEEEALKVFRIYRQR